MITIVPLALILGMNILFILLPQQSSEIYIRRHIRCLPLNHWTRCLLLALYVSFSKHGDIVLMNQVVFALLAGTATTFSLATPLTADIIIDLFNVPFSRATITVIILIITCIIYTYALLVGIKGISFLAQLLLVCICFLVYSLMF